MAVSLKSLDVPLPFGGTAPDNVGSAMPRDKSEHVENVLLLDWEY